MNIQLEDTDTPEDIGAKLAARFMWADAPIMECMLAALTDANFHSLRAQLEAVYISHKG
jgi:hypothetical protein